MEISELSKDNLSELVALVLQLWPECDYAEELENYKNILDAENEICYLSKVQGHYSAFIHVSIRSDYVEGATTDPVAYIEALYVEPGQQRSGIGRHLLAAAEDWARQKGCRQLASDTELNNTNAISFHLRSGFTEANRIVCFIKEV